jgi:hypothetical protein
LQAQGVEPDSTGIPQAIPHSILQGDEAWTRLAG